MTALPNSEKARVQFFLDCACPWSFLVLDRVREAAVPAARRILAYLTAVFDALFRNNEPVNELEVVAAIARGAGFDAATFADQIRNQASVAVIQDNAAELVARGGSGTPLFLIGDDLYFGNGRMPLVEAALARQGGMRLTLPGAHGV